MVGNTRTAGSRRFDRTLATQVDVSCPTLIPGLHMHYSLITDQISRLGLSEPLATDVEPFPADNPATTGHPTVFSIQFAECAFEVFSSTSRAAVLRQIHTKTLFLIT